MVMMFPYSGHLPAGFNFNASSILAKSSNEVIKNFHISYSSVNNRSSASLSVTLDSEGIVSVIFLVSK